MGFVNYLYGSEVTPPWVKIRSEKILYGNPKILYNSSMGFKNFLYGKAEILYDSSMVFWKTSMGNPVSSMGIAFSSMGIRFWSKKSRDLTPDGCVRKGFLTLPDTHFVSQNAIRLGEIFP